MTKRGAPIRTFVEKGQRIGKGTVIDTDVRVYERRGARLRCECGNIYVASITNLVTRNGKVNTKSCGCLKRENMARVNRNRVAATRIQLIGNILADLRPALSKSEIKKAASAVLIRRKK